MAQNQGVQGVGSVGGASGASATTQTQAPQAQTQATTRTAHEPTSSARNSSDTFQLSDEAAEESGDHRPTPAIGRHANDAAPANGTKDAEADKDAKDAKEAEEKKKAEEEAKKKEIEELQKKIEELEKKLEEQQKSGDKEGAKQTQAQLDSARQQLKDLTEPQSANPLQAVQGAGSQPAGNFRSDNIPQNIPASHPYYNQGAPGSATAPGGMSAPGGPSAPGTSAGPGANAKPISPEDLKKGTPMGQALAQEALKHATDGTGDGQHCFRNVSQDLEKFGIKTSGASAYMAADQLAQSDKLKEVSGVSQDDLKKLPPGAVVVWNRGGGHEHGHISIAMGDGREASDVMRNQITNYGTSYRVFLPNDG